MALSITAPKILDANPGVTHKFNVTHQDDERNWKEEVNLIHLLASVFEQEKFDCEIFEEFLLINEDLVIQPRILSLEFSENNQVTSTTTIQVTSYKKLPLNLFEYQHSAGNNAQHSILKGFTNWVKTDFITILEAVEGLQSLSCVTFEYPNKKSKRVVVYGPISHCVNEQADREHTFCPCCFFNNSIDAFKDMLETDQVHGIRFFASRNDQGKLEADCRVDGIDFEIGKQALLAYGETWPGQNFEYRKQYVIIKNEVEIKNKLGKINR